MADDTYTSELGDGSNVSVGGSDLGELKDIKWGGGGYEAVDGSNLKTVGLRRFLQTKSADGGEVTLEYISAQTQHPGSGEKDLVVTLPDGTTISYTVFVLSEDGNAPYKGLVTRTIKFKVTIPASGGQAEYAKRQKVIAPVVPATLAGKVA